MSDAKHTPGPWNVTENGGDAFDVKSEDYGTIALIHDPLARDMGRMDEVESNAHLIASAPDLLAACDKLYRVLSNQGNPSFEDWQQKRQEAEAEALSAIALAKGEA